MNSGETRAPGEEIPVLEQPPITEVVCGFIFDPIELDGLLLGVYWDRRRATFPTKALQPAISDRLVQISSESTASSLTFASIPKRFQDEVEIARRVLEEFHSDVELNEFEAYLHNLEMLARAVPNCTSIRDANVVARGLRAARARFIEQVASFANWTRLVRAIDPDESQRHIVPPRFIQVRVPIEEPPLILSDEMAQWDRALDMFMGTDADSASA